MESSKFKVYVKIDQNKCITNIVSDLILKDTTNYIQIDEGFGDKYCHAQGNYLDKGLMDFQGRYNYKLIDQKVIELTDEEKEELYPPITPQPSSTDVIIAKLMKLNAEQQTINSELMKQIAELKGVK